ncbi:MAG TPA: type II CAAX endopeptidase family protein [Holophagaceae bacterium]|nr:type II CAAX endopeptidase family protein [Holophagaceae bacterium]
MRSDSHCFDDHGRFRLGWKLPIVLGSALLSLLPFSGPLQGHPAGLGIFLAAAVLLWWGLASLRASDDRGRLRNGWKVWGFIVLSGLLSAITTVVLRKVFAITKVGNVGQVAFGVAIGLAASWICLRAERESLASIGFVPDRRWARELGFGVAGGAGIMLLTALLTMGLGGFHWIRGTATLGVAAWGFLLYVLVAFNEETLFRGYLFQRLIRGLGEWPTQLLMAGLFAFAHWGNPGMHGATKAWATLNIALAAVLLGLCYLRTKSLALPIGVHLGWNWTQGNLLGFGVSGTTDTPGLLQPVFHSRPDWLTGGAFGLEASLPCALVCGAVVLALALWKPAPSAAPSIATEA